MNNINLPRKKLLPDKANSKTRTKLEASDALTTIDYKPSSRWTNVWYGIGMLAFILIPVFIPGMTVKVTAIVLYGLITGVYIAAGLFSAVKLIKARNKASNQ